MRASKRSRFGEQRSGGRREARPAQWLLVAMASLGAAGCPGAPAPDPLVPGLTANGPTGSAVCAQPLPEESPTFAEVTAPPPPASRWTARIDVALARLHAQLDEGLPVKLAAGQAQGPGSPGRVSYSIRRSGLDLRIDGGELVVDIPVVGHANVCVPMGPICPSVGSCSPAMLATARVPLDLGPALTLQARRVDIKLTRGCVIAGVDASSRIVGGASRYADQMKQRINELLPTIRPEVEAAWQRLQTPIPMPGDRCALATLERVTHRALDAPAGMLSFAVAVEGRLQPAASCPAANARAATTALPKASRRPDLSTEASLAIPRRLDWPTLVAGLQSSLGAATDRPAGLDSLTVVEARATRPATRSKEAAPSVEANQGRLALRVELAGSRCGELWLLARPALDPQEGSIRLRDVELAPGQPQRAALVQGLGLEPWFAAHARIVHEPSGGASGTVRAGGESSAARSLLEHAQRTIGEACHVRTPEPRLSVARAATSFADPVVTPDGLVVHEVGRVELGIRLE